MSVTTVVRASSLSSYQDCPRRWAARHLRREIEALGFEVRILPSSIGAAVGSGTHAGAAYLLSEKMASGESGNLTEAEQRALDELEHRIIDEGVIWDDTTGNLNTAQQQTRRMVRAYRTHVVPGVHPVAVEQRITKTFAPGWTLSGQADVFEDDVLHDTKTGTVRRANMPQYGCYSLLRRSPRPEDGAPDGEPVNGIVEDFIRRVSLKPDQPPPERYPYPVEAAEQLAWAVMHRIKADTERFRETGDLWAFMPNPMSQMCSPKYCPAFNTAFCRAHKQE